MSFIIAEKKEIDCEDGKIQTTCIYGDTKLTPNYYAPNRINWGEKTFKLVQKYGIIKTMIIGSKCCISFAGNDISNAHKLLEYIFSSEDITFENITEKAFSIHKAAPKYAIEFIICTADDQNKTNITCIKDGEITKNCNRAWIGSQMCYKAFMAEHEKVPNDTSMLSLLERAIPLCGDESVGGFISSVRYDCFEGCFVYSEYCQSVLERNQIVDPGENINLIQNAAEGGYTVFSHEDKTDIILEFVQTDLIILFTNRYRLEENDIIKNQTKYFLLPILVKKSTHTVIDVT